MPSGGHEDYRYDNNNGDESEGLPTGFYYDDDYYDGWW
jgi:hypothetical protein